MTEKQINELCNNLRGKKKRIVFTNGCFDILHLGHIKYLEQARALGDFLFVGLNSDASVALLKGPHRPVQSEGDREAILLALKSVDAVSIFTEDTPLNLIKLVLPDVLVKGGDWAPDKIVGKEVVEARGGIVKSLAFIKDHSTSEILKKIKTL